MELTTEDKQRIEQEAKKLICKYYGTEISFTRDSPDPDYELKLVKDGAEYATIYEREKQAEQAQDQIDSDHIQIKQLEAERTNIKSLLRRYIELQRSAESFSHEGALDKQRVWEELKKFAGI